MTSHGGLRIDKNRLRYEPFTILDCVFIVPPKHYNEVIDAYDVSKFKHFLYARMIIAAFAKAILISGKISRIPEFRKSFYRWNTVAKQNVIKWYLTDTPHHTISRIIKLLNLTMSQNPDYDFIYKGYRVESHCVKDDSVRKSTKASTATYPIEGLFQFTFTNYEELIHKMKRFQASRDLKNYRDIDDDDELHWDEIIDCVTSLLEQVYGKELVFEVYSKWVENTVSRDLSHLLQLFEEWEKTHEYPMEWLLETFEQSPQ